MSYPVGGFGREKSNRINIASSYKLRCNFSQCTYLPEPQEGLTEEPKEKWFTTMDLFFF